MQGTCLILVTKELLKVSIPRLAANVQACEEFTVILDGGELLLTFALASWSGSAEHLQLVTSNWVIHCLCSVQQTLSGEKASNCSWPILLAFITVSPAAGPAISFVSSLSTS